MIRTLPLRLNLAVPSPKMGSGVPSPRMAKRFTHLWYEMKAPKSRSMTSVAPELAHASSASFEVKWHTSDDVSYAGVTAVMSFKIDVGIAKDAVRAEAWWRAQQWQILLSLRWRLGATVCPPKGRHKSTGVE